MGKCEVAHWVFQRPFKTWSGWLRRPKRSQGDSYRRRRANATLPFPFPIGRPRPLDVGGGPSFSLAPALAHILRPSACFVQLSTLRSWKSQNAEQKKMAHRMQLGQTRVVLLMAQQAIQIQSVGGPGFWMTISDLLSLGLMVFTRGLI